MSSQPTSSRLGGVVAALRLVQFVDVLGVTVVVTALPPMRSDVGGSATDSTLVATGYAMFLGGLLMSGARLGDRLGHRRTILASLALLAAAASGRLSRRPAAARSPGREPDGARARVQAPIPDRTV